ncbi:MAG: hypothetical protein QM831_44900 [Kofleriaceae bacterium]
MRAAGAGDDADEVEGDEDVHGSVVTTRTLLKIPLLMPVVIDRHLAGLLISCD